MEPWEGGCPVALAVLSSLTAWLLFLNHGFLAASFCLTAGDHRVAIKISRKPGKTSPPGALSVDASPH
jgi:hypothetical protein